MVKLFIILIALFLAIAGCLFMAWEDTQFKKKELARLKSLRESREARLAPFEKDLARILSNAFFKSTKERSSDGNLK